MDCIFEISEIVDVIIDHYPSPVFLFLNKTSYLVCKTKCKKYLSMSEDHIEDLIYNGNVLLLSQYKDYRDEDYMPGLVRCGGDYPVYSLLEDYFFISLLNLLKLDYVFPLDLNELLAISIKRNYLWKDVYVNIKYYISLDIALAISKECDNDEAIEYFKAKYFVYLGIDPHLTHII